MEFKLAVFYECQGIISPSPALVKPARLIPHLSQHLQTNVVETICCWDKVPAEIDRHPLPVQHPTENRRRKHVPSFSNMDPLIIHCSYIYSAPPPIFTPFIIRSSNHIFGFPFHALHSPLSLPQSPPLLLPSSSSPFSCHPPVFSHSGGLQMVEA